MSQIISTGKFSIAVQLLTGAVDIYGIRLAKVPETTLLRDLLTVELIVQVVEFIYYVWMIKNVNKYKNITIFRYIDWLFTTPTMLLTLMAYLGGDPTERFTDFIKREQETVTAVLALNFAMIGSGFLGELDKMPQRRAVIVGFIPFLLYYYLIFDKYVKNNDKITDEKKNVFWFFFIVWGIYGIAGLQEYNTKNVMYNFLDLIAKNGFGIYLTYRIYAILKSQKLIA